MLDAELETNFVNKTWDTTKLPHRKLIEFNFYCGMRLRQVQLRGTQCSTYVVDDDIYFKWFFHIEHSLQFKVNL